jgi:acyl-CoA thioesterase
MYMTLEKLEAEIQDLSEVEINTIHKLVQALKRTRVSPLAYIEEMMNFQFMQYDEEEDTYIHRMSVTDELKNRYKILHGGITATFIDTAMGATAVQALGVETSAVTIDLQVHFLSPGKEGWLYAHTKFVKKGKTIITMESKVKDEQGKLIATASSTFFRLK